eukprot:6455044-Amphidinium_carterae.1
MHAGCTRKEQAEIKSCCRYLPKCMQLQAPKKWKFYRPEDEQQTEQPTEAACNLSKGVPETLVPHFQQVEAESFAALLRNDSERLDVDNINKESPNVPKTLTQRMRSGPKAKTIRTLPNMTSKQKQATT